MKNRILAVGLALALTVANAAAQRRPITHEDVWLAKRLGSPVVSPDGKWAAIQVSEPAYDERDQTSDLWLVPTDGSARPRRLTATRASESGAAWSGDSRRIAFSSRRDGDEAPQIYVLDVVSGGEAQRVTNLSTGARSPLWRPDGGSIAVVSDVYPGARSDDDNRRIATERRNRKWNARVYESFPIRDWDRWLDDRHPTLVVQALDPGGQPTDVLAGSRLVAGAGFGGQSGSGSDTIAATWTPDGRGLVFAATTNRNEAAFADVAQPLWYVAASGGEPQRLTPGADSYGRPLFSRDGKTLFATFEPATDRVYNANRLVAFDWVHGGPHSMCDRPVRSRWNYHLLAQPGYVVLLTNYTGSTGYGEKFASEHPGRSAGGTRARNQPGRRRSDQAFQLHRRHAPGRRRRQLRRPPRQLAGGDHHEIQGPREPRRALRSGAAVGNERYGVRTASGTPAVHRGRRRRLDHAESTLTGLHPEDADAGPRRRTRLPCPDCFTGCPPSLAPRSPCRSSSAAR